VAFVVGVFPTVGMQLLRRAVGKVTGRFRGGLEPPYPLSQLDGMDIWSEARLVEVGIEDVQHLATADLVDVVLGARIPTQRIVDWVDQALLVLRTGLPRIDNLREYTTYADLRALSVRSSSDLLELVDKLQLDLAPNGPWPGIDSPVGALAAVPPAPPQPIGGPSLTRTAAVPLLTRIALAATTLQHEPNLALILHWHACDPEAGCGERRSGRPARRPAGGSSGEEQGRSAAAGPSGSHASAGNSSSPEQARSPVVLPGSSVPTA
jgi:hypothetical protein